MQKPSIAKLLEDGLLLHEQGALDRAINHYLDVLRIDPANADAHLYLARARCQQGRIAEGVDLARKCLDLDPGQARAHRLLGMALSRLGHHEEALASLDRAIALAPAAENHGLRGDILVALGRRAEAIESYDHALALAPHSPAEWCNRGAALHDLARYAEALESFDRAISLQPDFAEAHYNRGNALSRLERHAEALASYDRALALDPQYVDALNNRANALDRLANPELALENVERALAIDADHVGALTTRAVLLRKAGRSDAALASCQRALVLAPNDDKALTVCGDVLIDLERFDEALSILDRQIARMPAAAGPKWNKSLVCLGLGRFVEGWPLYEHRWAAAKGLTPRPYPQPRWRGERLAGTLMAWSEQGLGDEILHAGMLPDLMVRTSNIVLEVEPRLVALFARSFPAVKVIGLRPQLYDGPLAAQIPFGSLGGFFRRRWEDFPSRESGYLIADPARTAELRAPLAQHGRRVIGLSWISKAPFGGKAKSARLIDFAALLRAPGVRFVDLQYGDTADERDEVRRKLGIDVERLPDIDTMNDIDGLAALISACDTVVTVSNTTAHLAGALGTTTWVMVPHGHARIWYWFRDRPDSPWYPRVRVRRQTRGESWAEVVARVAREISTAPDTTG
jgi:tetratricopeptide (TPR) repeat protein